MDATELLVPGALRSDTYAVRSRVASDDAEEEAIRFPAAGTPSTTGRASEADGPASTHALFCFAAIGFANVVCQAIFSVLPTFFPPVAKSKGMSDFVLGVSFAAMPAVVFSVSAIADQIMYAYGRRRIFILGNAITAAFTALLGAATLMPDGAPFAAFCLVSQIGQGFGSALAEASSFALIAELFPRRVTFYFGLNETFTGLGVAIGPPIGGLLFALGGFWCPFVTLAIALLPGIVFIHVTFRPSAAEGFEDEIRRLVLASLAGFRLPLESHPLQALVSEPMKPIFPTVVMSNAIHAYISQSDKGDLVIGAGIDHYTGYGQRGSFPIIEGTLQAIVELFPLFSRVRMNRQWGGIVDVSPDACPIIGLTPVKGLYINCGWGTGGFKATPGSGWVMAHTVAQDRPHPLNEAFSLDRFHNGHLIDEHGAAAVAH